jgi:hypothetical protein
MTFPLLEISITRDFLMSQRQALLMQLDSIERLLDISPRTAELRKERKALNPPPQYQCELDYEKRQEKEAE